jgi:hypothetical protein
MNAPILLVVDEDQAVLEALSGDLGRRFGVDYRILTESSPARALAVLERLAAESRQVALVFAGQQLTGTSGVEFLAAAHGLHPIVGRQWEPRSHRLREVLTRLAFPYRFHPHDSEEGWRRRCRRPPRA